MKRAVIILGGSVTDYDYTRKLIFDDDIIICADGGWRHIEEMNLTPDVWIGDNDSANLTDNKLTKLAQNCKVIRLNPIKDATDGEAACNYVCENRFDDVLIIGFFGTRLDHVLGNIFLLKKFSDCGISATAVNENNRVYFAQRHNEIQASEFKYVSVIPISDSVDNVSNIGLYYSLRGESLQRYSTRGISNEPLGDSFVIDIGSGDALIILSKD